MNNKGLTKRQVIGIIESIHDYFPTCKCRGGFGCIDCAFGSENNGFNLLCGELNNDQIVIVGNKILGIRELSK